MRSPIPAALHTPFAMLGVLSAAVLGILSALAAPLEGQAGQEAPTGASLPVVSHTLENGMRLLVLERHASPTVAFMVHYPVGSVNERLGNTGISHVLEHMLFKGTTEIGTLDFEQEEQLLERIDLLRDSLRVLEREGSGPGRDRLQEEMDALRDSATGFVVPNEFDQILSRAGARGLNATTTHEATRYFVELPANQAELWFILESDRMTRPVFREFYTELDVVAEERRLRIETSPGAQVQSALLATAFQVHPYGVPVIGHASDLEQLTRSQTEAFFSRYYGARNAVVAVVGDVDGDQILAWAERYFSRVPAGELPPTARPVEPEQNGERRVEVEYDASPQLAIGWRGVSAEHPDYPALSVLASTLAGGRTSRLYQRLVQNERSAIQVSAFQGPGVRDPGLFWIAAVTRDPHPASSVEQSIYAEIDSLLNHRPEESVLRRIRNQIRASDVRRLGSNSGLAAQLAESEAILGDWRATFRRSRAILEVDADDVVRVAKKYLVRSRRTVATLVTHRPSR